MRYIDAIAVTVGPGLIGSLLIGVEAAKTIAMVTEKPIIPVNHVLAHMYANFLKTEDRKQKTENEILRPPPSVLRFPTFPAISLVVSGGHTELFLMKNEKELKWLGGTIDDAAGEAFDKSARLLGFGSRGGIAIQETAKKYDVRSTMYEVRIKLPRPLMNDETLNFSFSGLKTAILREVEKLKHANALDEKTITSLAYEVQEAITDVLVTKTIKAAEMYEAKSIMISGGVASNERLREKFLSSISLSPHLPIQFHCPPVELCTDNAAFIGSYAFFRGIPEDWHTITAVPDLSVEG
jgi:N6-L-threonylcarbamoyladenine synthase